MFRLDKEPKWYQYWRFKMLEIIPLDGSQNIQFENYNELFDYIIETENLTLLKRGRSHMQSNWSFTTYSPKQVSALFTHGIEPQNAIKEAYNEGLPLFEICAGSYEHPLYIVKTPNVDMDYLRRKWCLDYCTYHDLILKDYFNMLMGNLPISRSFHLNEY